MAAPAAPVASTTARASISSSPLGTGHLGPTRCRPSGHHRAGPDVHAAGDRPVHPPAGVGRSAQDAPQVPQAEAGVLAQAGDPARLVLPVHDHDASRAPPTSARWPRPGRRDRHPRPARRPPRRVAAHRRHPATRPTGPRRRRRRRSPDSARWSPWCAGAHRRGPRRGPGSEGIAHLALGDPLAEAHDVAVGRITLDQLGVLEGASRPLGQLRACGGRPARAPPPPTRARPRPSAPTTCSAMASEAVRPVDRMPPTQA